MWVLLLLLVAISIVYGIPFLRAVSRGEKTPSFSVKHFDKVRFFGTIILTIAYFLSMDYVGGFFPNMGLGFLLMSIPFMLLLSLLYVHNLDRRKVLLIGLNSLISPGVAWYVLANMFNISLP
jgi:tellurite resistance protein TehA-like permease